MLEITTKTFRSFIAAAVKNKYVNATNNDIENIVSETIVNIQKDDELQLVSKLRPVITMNDDVINQTIVLTLIERNWTNPPKLEYPLTKINMSLSGEAKPKFRTRDYVEDLGGKAPTNIQEIASRLDELERLCRQSVRSMNGDSLEDKAMILAHIYGSLIRIHPFEDGNGRTARLFVFYALRCWRLPIFVIPKVRNNIAWKEAMECAVAGDGRKLVIELKTRIKDAIHH